MPEITVEVEVYCARCGAGLCNQTDVISKGRREAFSVEPCQRCLEGEWNDGYDKGKEADHDR